MAEVIASYLNKEEVLKSQPVGINDSFLDLGSNSLQAMQIVKLVAIQSFAPNLTAK